MLSAGDVTKHRTGRAGAKYWSRVLVKCLVRLGCGFPDAFFCSRESGIRKCHSRDSRAPGNGVYCSIISAVALWKVV